MTTQSYNNTLADFQTETSDTIISYSICSLHPRKAIFVNEMNEILEAILFGSENKEALEIATYFTSGVASIKMDKGAAQTIANEFLILKHK
jgi:hypothetical protein